MGDALIPCTFKTFKFINTSPSQGHAFGLKNVASLKELPLDFIDFMCPSIIG
jgi:hypothetical protein